MSAYSDIISNLSGLDKITNVSECNCSALNNKPDVTTLSSRELRILAQNSFDRIKNMLESDNVNSN